MVPSTSVTFVSKASIDSGRIQSYNLRKRIEAVKNCRNITKKDMKYNDAMPKMKVDPERYVSKIASKMTIQVLTVIVDR
jgi:urease